MEVFLEDCITLNLTEMFDNEGYTPLMKAVYAGDEALTITKLLCNKVFQTLQKAL